MTTSLIHSVHVQFSQCKYCTDPLHIYRIRSWRLWQNWRGNSHSYTHKSPSPHVMSVLQDAAPRAFGTCLLTRMEIWTYAMIHEFVRLVILNLDRDVPQKACIYMQCINSFCVHESNFVVWICAINLGKLWLSHTIAWNRRVLCAQQFCLFTVCDTPCNHSTRGSSNAVLKDWSSWDTRLAQENNHFWLISFSEPLHNVQFHSKNSEFSLC